MRIEDTTLSFLEEDCLQRFGRAEGAEVFSRTQERYRDLLEGADDHGAPPSGNTSRKSSSRPWPTT